MKIQLDLTPNEIELLRQAMDSIPLRPYAPIICKVLLALPIFESVDADTIPVVPDAAPAPHSLGAGRGNLHPLFEDILAPFMRKPS